MTSTIDDRERFIIAYQKCHSISLNSDTSDSCNDENFESIPKMFAKAKTKELHQIKVENFMVFDELHFRLSTQKEIGQLKTTNS